MPLAFGPSIKEGKVYRSKRKQEGDDEKQALRELQTILGVKNRRACDCEAQIHDLLENCLACGRLTCVAEGSGKCFSCGNIILSYEQRERLKKHIDILQPCSSDPSVNQRQQSTSDGALRTKIIDNQFDHFAIDNKKHLKEEDRRKLRENLEELQAQRYQRKLMLEVDVDNLQAGSRSTPQIDDYEEALRKLQLNHHQQTATMGSEVTLAELVLQESKRSYAFEYIDPNQPTKKRLSEGVRVDVGNSLQKQKQAQLSSKSTAVQAPKQSGSKKVPKKNNNNNNGQKRSQTPSAWKGGDNKNNKDKN